MCMCDGKGVSACVCLYACLRVCVCVSACEYANVHACVYVFVYVCGNQCGRGIVFACDTLSGEMLLVKFTWFE